MVSQADWEAILKAAFDLGQQNDKSPIDVIEGWIGSEDIVPDGFPVNDVQPKKLASMAEWLTATDLNELRIYRVADAVTVGLNRRCEDPLAVWSPDPS